MQQIDLRALRKKVGLNQTEFWSRIGVTQSGGCRYEQGRRMPKPVFELLRLVHIEGVDLTKVTGEDLAVLEYLKTEQNEIYQNVRLQVDSPSLRSS